MPLDVILLSGADFSFLIEYFLLVYGWPLLMLLLATAVGRWFSPWLLFLGLPPLVLAPLGTGLDPIPWVAAIPYFAAVLVAEMTAHANRLRETGALASPVPLDENKV